MPKKRNLKEKITSALSLPGEITLNLPLLSLTGNRELLLENYKNILEFSGERIRVNTTSGIFAVKGRGLYIKRITSENIVISGAIGNIELGG